MRGREVEWGLVLDLLDGTMRGKGGVLLVEGEPGSGKTMLLAAAAEVAGDHGFVLGTSDADELARFTPLAPPHAAMPGAVAGPARRPVVTGRDGRPATCACAWRNWRRPAQCCWRSTI